MVSINNTFEYIELACDNFDATAPGGNSFTGSNSPLNEIVYSWPKFYWTQKTPDIVGMKVLNVTIQNVWDTVNLLNQTFAYSSGGVQTNVTVPTGSYTGATLATQLQTLLSAITPGLTVTFNATTQLFTFTQTISAAAWSLSFTSKESMYFHLGFLPVSVNGAVGVGSTVVSTIIANPEGPRFLYLNSNQIGPLINFNLTDANSAFTSSAMAKIPVIGAKNSFIEYNDQNPTMFFDFFVGTRFETFDLYWTLGSDQDQTPLDMKGSQWSVKLGFIGYRDATKNLEQKPNKRGSSMIS